MIFVACKFCFRYNTISNLCLNFNTLTNKQTKKWDVKNCIAFVRKICSVLFFPRFYATIMTPSYQEIFHSFSWFSGNTHIDSCTEKSVALWHWTRYAFIVNYSWEEMSWEFIHGIVEIFRFCWKFHLKWNILFLVHGGHLFI